MTTTELPAAHPYVGRTAFLATRHGKQVAIGPALASIGVDVEVVDADTDRLGTFTGDVPRPGSPLETAIAKARLAVDGRDARLAVASEGSLAPHPAVPWLTVDHELVVLVDDAAGLVIVGGASSSDVVAVSAVVAPDDGRLADVVRRADLPTHALVVRPNAGPLRPIVKGLVDPDLVGDAVVAAARASCDGSARVETDLRAHVCPSRRVVIAAAARDLAARIRRACPACGCPGWGVVDVVVGLPCGWCGLRVPTPCAHVEGCATCSHRVTVPIVADDARADPARCPSCNP